MSIVNLCERRAEWLRLPDDFGKKREVKNVGGLDNGNWYRFDKKTTTDECRSLDVRRFYWQGLLKPGLWFS
jgi:hypothetical protein